MDAPKTWRFRFGLRTLLIVVVILAVPMTWTSYSLRWIQQRRAFRTAHYSAISRLRPIYRFRDAPATLLLFDEPGVCGWYVKGMSDAEIAEARRLFPEAAIHALPNR